jgi:ankyrin repeat protein
VCIRGVNPTYIYIYIYIYQRQRTPLHLAAYGDHGKIVEALVEAKADLCAQNSVNVLKET